MSSEESDTTREPTDRLTIALQDMLPLVPDKLTIFSLPGELRNAIYHLALEKDYQRVPLNPVYLNKPDPYIALLQTCSTVYHEARSYMVEKQTAYILVMPGLDWSYGEPAADYGLSRATKDTTVCALTDFMSVHFHLHLELMRREDYDPDMLLASLAQAIKIFTKGSWALYLKHSLGKRRAVVHLDHLLSLWPKFGLDPVCIEMGTLQRLVELIAQDKMTDWEIRYYVGTGQANRFISYGHCCYPRAIQDAELAQLRNYTRPYSNIKIIAEIYGEDTTWEFGDATGCVTRTRTPVTEFWPNQHANEHWYPILLRSTFRSLPPDDMPIENFDEEVLQAKHARGGNCKSWLQEIEKKIQIRDAEAHGISKRERRRLKYTPAGHFKEGWKALLGDNFAKRDLLESGFEERPLEHDCESSSE